MRNVSGDDSRPDRSSSNGRNGSSTHNGRERGREARSGGDSSSTRAFKKTPTTTADLDAELEAFMKAPSAPAGPRADAVGTGENKAASKDMAQSRHAPRNAVSHLAGKLTLG